MLQLALALVLTAPPPVGKALDLAKAGSWEELYLGYAAAPAKDYPAADRKKLGEALGKGCVALAGSDAVMAFGLGEKAVEMEGSADALLCVGQLGPKVEQNSAAEAALKQGLSKFPNDGRFGLALGKQLLAENDAPGALAALEKVPKKSKEAGEAEALKKKAKALASEGASARAEADRDARAVERNEQSAGSGAPPPGKGGKVVSVGSVGVGPSGGPSTGLGSSYESSTDGEGRRIRANQHFRFRYFNGQRDFGQRADYEGRVQAALESARETSNKILGSSRQSATDVILYSREEFQMHHGASMARAVAGFYSENAIRMNDSAEINPRNQATLVHEYTHAVIDEAASFNARAVPIWMNEGLAEWVEWRFQGHDGPPAAEAAQLRALVKAGQLPQLKNLESQALINTGDPGAAYATSACAIRILVKIKGESEVMAMIRDAGKGTPWKKALEDRFGLTAERLQERLDDDLKRR
jgi:tetratricopeptide (TPR) repeat protein